MHLELKPAAEQQLENGTAEPLSVAAHSQTLDSVWNLPSGSSSCDDGAHLCQFIEQNMQDKCCEFIFSGEPPPGSNLMCKSPNVSWVVSMNSSTKCRVSECTCLHCASILTPALPKYSGSVKARPETVPTSFAPVEARITEILEHPNHLLDAHEHKSDDETDSMHSWFYPSSTLLNKVPIKVRNLVTQHSNKNIVMCVQAFVLDLTRKGVLSTAEVLLM